MKSRVSCNTDMHGHVAAGIYFVRMIAGESVAQDKALLVK